MNKEEVEKLGLQKGDILIVGYKQQIGVYKLEEDIVGIYGGVESQHWDPDWNSKEFVHDLKLLQITKKLVCIDNILKWASDYSRYNTIDIDYILKISKLGNIEKGNIEDILTKKLQ